MTRKQKKNLSRIIVSSVLLIVLNVIPLQGLLRAALFLSCYLLIGYDVLRKAGRGIINGRVFDENFLMAAATAGAIALAVYSGSQDYNEAVAVMLFYQIGELFQSLAVNKSRKSISALMDIRPDYANIEKDGKLVRVAPEELGIGSEIVVQPGEKLPIDGIVINGSSSLDTSALTGESVPRRVNTGDEVFSGCVNLSGVLKVRTTREFGESTVSKILELVENAGSRKARSENFISKFSRIYTPAVCISALALAVVPPLFLMLTGNQARFGDWLYRALTFLVISCPCALVVSIPLSFFAGIGGAGREGILIKGSNFIEALAETAYVVFDKTGTLTEGVFRVTGVYNSTIDKEKLIELAALAESASSHPISRSLREAYGKEPDRSRISGSEEISGHGVVALVDGKQVAAGSERLMRKLGIEYPEIREAGTLVYVSVDAAFAGCIVISDVIKETAAAAIRELKKAGINRIIMLTGDNGTVASHTAAALGLDEYHSGLLPADKVAKVEELLKRKPGNKKLAFAGDGINDAPVLMRADIGIAMGAMGSDAAIEAADVVLMDDNPLKLVKAVKLSRKCLRIVKQNTVFAIGIKLSCLILSAAGLANMWLAVFADVGVMVLAILNAIRAMNVRRL